MLPNKPVAGDIHERPAFRYKLIHIQANVHHVPFLNIAKIGDFNFFLSQRLEHEVPLNFHFPIVAGVSAGERSYPDVIGRQESKFLH